MAHVMFWRRARFVPTSQPSTPTDGLVSTNLDLQDRMNHGIWAMYDILLQTQYSIWTTKP